MHVSAMQPPITYFPLKPEMAAYILKYVHIQIDFVRACNLLHYYSVILYKKYTRATVHLTETHVWPPQGDEFRPDSRISHGADL